MNGMLMILLLYIFLDSSATYLNAERQRSESLQLFDDQQPSTSRKN